MGYFVDNVFDNPAAPAILEKTDADETTFQDSSQLSGAHLVSIFVLRGVLEAQIT